MRNSYSIKMFLIDEIKDQQEDSYSKIKSNIIYKKLNANKRNRRSTLDGFLNSLVFHSRGSAKLRGLEHTLGSNFLYELYKKQNGLCALSNIPMTIINSNLRENRINLYNISIDRIDSSIGYTKDNIQLVCACINIMKLDHSSKLFIELCKSVAVTNV